MSTIGNSIRLLPYFQANKVIFHSSIDVDRRPSAPVSEAFTAMSIARE